MKAHLITYTEEWNGFQIREPVYMDSSFNPFKFDLVKWNDRSQESQYTLKDLDGNVASRTCFSIAMLEYDPDDGEWNIQMIGLRYLEYRIDGLEEFIKDFCDKMNKKFQGWQADGQTRNGCWNCEYKWCRCTAPEGRECVRWKETSGNI